MTVSEDRLQELESRLTFHEHLVEELNDALSRQQLLIADLNNKVRILLDRTRQLIEEGRGANSAGDEKPPHY